MPRAWYIPGAEYLFKSSLLQYLEHTYYVLSEGSVADVYDRVCVCAVSKSVSPVLHSSKITLLQNTLVEQWPWDNLNFCFQNKGKVKSQQHIQENVKASQEWF